VAELASVMRNTAQPFGHADPARPNISTTQWQTITDLSNLVYMFSSSLRPNPVWVHLDPLDLEDGDPVCMVDLVNDRYLIGDVTVDFMPAAPFTFATDTR
jgi:choloylglycine hydrolase